MVIILRFLLQPWNTALASNVPRSVSAPSLQPPQGVPSSGGLQSSEVKPSGRTELPAVSIYISLFGPSYLYILPSPGFVNDMLNCLQDLFTVTYPSYHAVAVPGWQAGPPRGMHYGMQQYNNTMVQ